VKEGVAAEGDLIRVKIERDRAAIDEAVARTEWVHAIAELRPFLWSASRPGSPPRLAIDSASAIAALPAFDAILARARLQQPELLAARARAEAARAEVEVQRSLTVRQLGATFGNKRIGGQNSMIAGVSVPLPFFDRNRGEIVRAAAERVAAEREAEWVERTLVARIEGAYESAKLLADGMRVAGGDLVQRAEESRQIAIAAYREGAGTLLQVLDASRTLADVRLASARLLFAQRETLLQLDAASGVDPLTSFGITPEHTTTGGHP
jgi:cobalt-zinc-cadmium efflux system outer membrane protein